MNEKEKEAKEVYKMRLWISQDRTHNPEEREEKRKREKTAAHGAHGYCTEHRLERSLAEIYIVPDSHGVELVKPTRTSL